MGDFGISTVDGTLGSAYDPSLSTAGSSGGSATAVVTSLAALAVGTATCNSLSNPSSFTSLATIRTRRGLTSGAGVMPLRTHVDAVGPMGTGALAVTHGYVYLLYDHGAFGPKQEMAFADASVRGA